MKFIKESIKLALSLFLCLFTGFAAAAVTAPSLSGWYQSITKSIFTPPDNVFTPVWRVLYIVMGVSFFLIWRRGFGTKSARKALYLFLIQLFLNFLWSLLFFGYKMPAIAFIEIIILIAIIILTIAEFYKLSKIAALVLLPYLFWVGFASYLNLMVVVLNRTPF